MVAKYNDLIAQGARADSEAEGHKLGLGRLSEQREALQNAIDADKEALRRSSEMTLAGPATADQAGNASPRGLTESDLKQAVPLIHVGDSAGSGFFVTSRGHLITNRHVIEGAQDPPRVLWDHSLRRDPELFRVIDTSADYDLALLTPSQPGGTYRHIELREEYGLGRDLLAAGFPLAGRWAERGSPLDLTLSRGTLSAVRRKEGHPIWLQTDCNVASGSSGGPLIDRETGRAIGVITKFEMPTGTDVGSGAGLAVPTCLVLEAFGKTLAK